MKVLRQINNHIVTAFVLLLLVGPVLTQPGFAFDQGKVDEMLDRLAAAKDAPEGQRIESALRLEWEKSGSAAIDLLYRRGADAFDLGHFDAAIEHLSAAIDHDPAFTAAYDLRAMAYYSAGQIGPAVADLAQTLALEPRHFSALSGLGTIFEARGEFEKARSAYQMAAKIHPFMADVNDAIKRLKIEIEGQEL